MISRKTTNSMLAAASILAAIFLLLSALKLFHTIFGWVEYSIIGAIGALIFVAGLSRLRRRSEEILRVRSTRATVLKDVWEKRHNREW